MDSIWSILGIAPTTDITAIKQAYAARAKDWHPEERPEEFKLLRNAYKTAISYAKNNAAKSNAADDMAYSARQPSQPQHTERSAESSAQHADHTAQGQTIGQEPQYSYEDVSSFFQKELAERFFKEFRWIAWNPYLQNKRAIWSCFLFQIDYDDLYYHENFLQMFFREIDMIPGWNRDILNYFEWWLSLYQNFDSKQWRRKKKRSSLPHPTPEHVVSQEMRKKHYEILQTVRDKGLDDRLLNAASAEAYLKYYGTFLSHNENWLAEQRKIANKKRWRYRIAAWAFLALLSTVLVLEFIVKPMSDKIAARRLREQQALEEQIRLEERERLEQEAWQMELDERFQIMQEQYEKWTGQEE